MSDDAQDGNDPAGRWTGRERRSGSDRRQDTGQPTRNDEQTDDASSSLTEQVREAKEVAAGAAAQASTVADLAGDVRALVQGVFDLRGDLARRKVEHQSAMRRMYRTVVLLLIGVIMAMWVVDIHTEACVVNVIIHQADPFICDATFPIHTHGVDRAPSGEFIPHDWPTDANVVGLAVWTLVAVLIAAGPRLIGGARKVGRWIVRAWRWLTRRLSA